jgi:uncharacterized protein YjbI with pentapeptide repeats
MQNARLNIRGFLAILTFTVFVSMTSATGLSQSKPAETPTVDQELTRAKKSNDDAQAEYYRQLTRKIQEPPPTPTPRKTFRDSPAESPATVIGIVGTILAAGLVALVGLVTLFVNSRYATRSQRDTQFYEALKRFGDKDSPTIRASAAGLLGQMAQSEGSYLAIRKTRPFVKIERPLPYFTTALDQLLTGLLLEENVVALKSVGDAIKQLIRYDPNKTTEKLYHVNLKIQEELGSLLAELFVINGWETAPDPNDTTHTHWGIWEQAQSLVGYDQWVLRDFVLKSNSFKTTFKNYLQALKAKGNENTGLVLESLQDSLRIASSRLQTNVGLYCTALGQSHWNKEEHNCFHGSFLIGGNMDLQSADLNFVDLSFSQLTALWLFKTNMNGAAFIETNLKGASLHHGSLRDGWLSRAQLDHAGLEDMDLTNTKFAEAQISDWTKLRGSNWWKGDFYLPVGGGVDAPLLEKLFEKYGNEVPKNLDQVHASVRHFIDAKRSSAKPSPIA